MIRVVEAHCVIVIITSEGAVSGEEVIVIITSAVTVSEVIVRITN